MEATALKQALSEYVDDILKIRSLSAVPVDEAEDAKGYCDKLKEDYRTIGELGVLCRRILDETIYRIASNSEPIEEDVLAILQEFCTMLLEPGTGEELDLSLLFEISDRLLTEFKRKGDEDGYITQAYMHVIVCYANVNRTARITVSRETTAYYRDEGLRAADIVRGFVRDKDKFLRLSPKTRERAIVTMQSYSALYDTFFAESDTNHIRYQALVDAIKLYDDPFYHENTEGYDWELHRYRCIEQIGELTERGNRWGFSTVQCEAFCAWLSLLEKLETVNAGLAARLISKPYLRLMVLRNSYFADHISKEEYQNGLLELYENNSAGDDRDDACAVRMNLLVPAEYLYTLRDGRLSARTMTGLHELYDKVIRYMLTSVNSGTIRYIQEYLPAFLEMFIELPGAMSFEVMGLYCMAALHPPTYVHSRQVADISKCLADRLLETNPGVFVKEFGYGSADEAAGDRTRILDFIYHSALCHDFGKIAMFDSIVIYGRNLLDSEYNIIRKHTAMGEKMLLSFPSTVPYADIAKNHHVWYNGKGGYPVGSTPKFPVCVNILEAADSIDAATDSIGRSYHNVKTLEEILEEFEKESGTRYAPYIADLLEQESVCEDLEYFLGEGRQKNYDRTFGLLTGRAPIEFK
jgi:HD-GYP domain-containing protein (c-di-GMP phosphodiesterase class II)